MRHAACHAGVGWVAAGVLVPIVTNAWFWLNLRYVFAWDAMQNSFCSGTAVTRVPDNCFVVFRGQTCAIRVRLVSSLTSTECSTLCHPYYALPQQVDSIPSHTRYTSTSHFLFIHHYFFYPPLQCNQHQKQTSSDQLGLRSEFSTSQFRDNIWP